MRPGWYRIPLIALGVCISLLIAFSVSTNLAGASSDGETEASSASGGEAKNVILLIGDGMGDSEITITRNYEKGADGTLAMDTLDNTGAYTTHSVREDEPEVPDYVPDSAATGTAWATGQKTSNNRVSTTPGTDEDLETILEQAQQQGKKTGNVSSAELTDATPAVLNSKVEHRDCKGPEDTAEECPQDSKAEGDPGSIAEQTVDHEVDVLLGGARDSFEQEIDGGPDEGSTVLESAEGKGYNVAETEEEMESAPAGEPLLGLFADENLETIWSGEPAKKNLTFNTEPQTCNEDNAPDEQPTLEAMTDQAIGRLQGDEGFFLQVEGASIDKEDHVANPCEQIGENIDFDNSVQAALDYAEQDPDTMVVVTGDHGHTSQIVPGPESGYFDNDYEYTPPGESSLLETADGTSMMVSYATNHFRDENGEEVNEGEDSHTHTGTQIRIAGQGPGSEGVTGLTDQTDLFDTMASAMGTDGSAGGGISADEMPETGGISIPERIADLFSGSGEEEPSEGE